MDFEYLSTKEVRKIIGVTTPTLRKWANEGKIRFSLTPSGRKIYNKNDIFKIAGITKTDSRKIAYCRIYSDEQKDELEKQKEFFNIHYPEHKIITDISPGINFENEGFDKILELALQKKISEIVIVRKENLCRFGFNLIEKILKFSDVKLVVLNKEIRQLVIDTNLSNDIFSIIQHYVK